MTGHIDPSKEIFAAFRENTREGPIHMLNLVRLREHAAYPDGRKATGAEAYAAYGRDSATVFTQLGGKIVWRGKFELVLIGPTEERWDLCFIAQYPRVEAFVEMIRDPVYREAVKHRQAAVADSRLIRLSPVAPGEHFGADANNSAWAGRFPKNELISVLDVNRRFNLAESTSQDLTLGEIVDLAGGIEAVSGLKMGYGSSAGLARLRNVVSAISGVSPEEVVTTQGAALGLFLLAFELCRPGDEVVIASPCFPPSRDTLLSCGVELRVFQLSFDKGYRLRAEDIADQLNERTKLVSVASPQKPSGVRTSRDEIEALLAIMRERAPNAFLFVDETFRDATYGSELPPSSFAALDDRVITGASVSKAHGAPGLRTGWLTVRDPDLRERLVVAKLNTVVSGSPLDETLAAAILENREAVLAPRRRLLAVGVEQVAAWVHKESLRISWVRPDGGAFCCLRLNPSLFGAEQVRRFWNVLPAADLQLGDGAWFGETSALFRLGFGYLPPRELPMALNALSDTLDQALA
jgi:aspartate/methionine/tyrosine aminotransferase